ncbi:hypothetical protein [Dehalobacter restrictus]|uniref:Phage holin n=1 Tax=Dehalobacter restrictus TaxID=55583 RepID=A0A857DGN9_9FIRM|nr:hypothetical protein [Dehalobacter restrictus]QGZ99444.1 hypothetical protein GQ588_01565 [Dehalobacter restrictus]
MSTFLINIFTSDPAITIYIIAVMAGIGMLIKKFPWIKNYTDIVANVFSYIEDNYKTWGISGNEKLDYFIKSFIAKYFEKYGKTPTEDIIVNAVAQVENLVSAQNTATNK